MFLIRGGYWLVAKKSACFVRVARTEALSSSLRCWRVGPKSRLSGNTRFVLHSSSGMVLNRSTRRDSLRLQAPIWSPLAAANCLAASAMADLITSFDMPGRGSPGSALARSTSALRTSSLGMSVNWCFSPVPETWSSSPAMRALLPEESECRSSESSELITAHMPSETMSRNCASRKLRRSADRRSVARFGCGGGNGGKGGSSVPAAVHPAASSRA